VAVMRRFWLLCVLSMIVVVLSVSGCASGGGIFSGRPTATPIPDTFENNGYACFHVTSHATLHIVAGAETPERCWSSSCTLVLEERHDFTIDQVSRTIQLTWYVVARENITIYDFGARGGCTADCSGLPTWEAEFDNLEDGEYVVKIGDRAVGAIAVPYEHGSQQACFDSTHTFAPTPTTRSMSQSPLSTPAAAGSK